MAQRHFSYPVIASVPCGSGFFTTSPERIEHWNPAVLARWLAPAIAQAYEDVPAVDPGREDGDGLGCRR
jgi:hypothetical protein